MFRRRKDPGPRVVELETEIKKLKHENETLRRENAELSDKNNNLKETLDEAVRNWRPFSEQSSDSELQKKLNEKDEQLNRTIKQLSETRKQLLDVQSRQTVNEQVTAATQRRELIQEGVYENLPTDSVYEPLRFDPSQKEHVYAKLQPITHTGYSVVSLVRRMFFSHRIQCVCVSVTVRRGTAPSGAERRRIAMQCIRQPSWQRTQCESGDV